MKTMELKDASKPLADYAARLRDDGIVLTSKRRPVAALVSVRGVDAESLALSMNQAFLKLIRRARAEVRRGKVVSLDQIKQGLKDDAARPDAQSLRRRAPRR